MRDLGSLLTGMVAMILALILIIYMMSGCYVVTVPELHCTPAEYKVCSYTVEAACRPGERVRDCKWEMLRRESCWCVRPNPGWYR